MTPYELIWQGKESDIGWSFADHYLKRTTGLYDGSWKNKTTSIVAAGVAQVTFTPEKAQAQIIGVELKMEPKATQKKPVICFVAVRKGENHE